MPQKKGRLRESVDKDVDGGPVLNFININPKTHTNKQSTPKISHIFISFLSLSRNSEMENEGDKMMAFDMNSLRSNLPQKRGLSRYYSGKARSFTCISDVRSIEDLKKKEHPDASKKRKKYSERRNVRVPPYLCRRVSSTNQCATPPCVGA